MNFRIESLKKSILLIVSFFVFAINTSAQEKSNIVLLLVDDMGWTDLGCYGSSFYETPNIDALAKSGMRFTDAYSACTVCSPSRASILTGKSPARLHITDWITGHNMPYAKLLPPDWTQYLPLEETTIAEVLKKRGYATASIGKWHMGDDIKYYPENQGFDINIAGTYQGQPPNYFSPYKIPRLKNGPEGEYLTDRLTDEAERFITKNKDQPFFLYFPYYAVHTPLQAKAADIEYFKARVDSSGNQINATYAALVKSVDESVGRIMALINKLNLAENTLVIFTSDNGGLIGSIKAGKSTVTSNIPLRMGKGSPYEGGTRVPAIFSWKGKIKPVTVSHEPIIGTDLFSTIAALGDTPVNNKNLDGVDIMPLLSGKIHLDRKSLFWHYPHYHPQGGVPYSAIRQGDWKLIYFYEDDREELYNLIDDIGEVNNLVSKEPGLAKVMYLELMKWKDRTGAQNPIANPAYDESKKNKMVNSIVRAVEDPYDLN